MREALQQIAEGPGAKEVKYMRPDDKSGRFIEPLDDAAKVLVHHSSGDEAAVGETPLAQWLAYGLVTSEPTPSPVVVGSTSKVSSAH